jgi:HPt (histidine-containing phosphotransfer) domain-containing protein
LLKLIESFVRGADGRIETAPASIKVSSILDSDGALARLDGDKELLSEICDIFIEESPQRMERLKNALDNNNIVLVEREAHSLKSTAANIGAGLLRDSTQHVEVVARNSDISKARILYEMLEHEHGKVLSYLGSNNKISI